MKTILYAFIKNCRVLKDVNVNFSQDESWNYDPKSGRLTRSQNDKSPEGLFGSRINSVTSIVGQNGTGKSSLLKWLLERTVYGSAPLPLGGIMVFRKQDGSIKAYHDVRISNKKDFPEGTFIEISESEYNDTRHDLAIPSFYYSDTFEPYIEMTVTSAEYTGEVNMSDKFLLLHDITSYKNLDWAHLVYPMREHMNAFFLQNNIRICTLLFDKTFQTTFKDDLCASLNLPRYIIFSPNTSADEMIRMQIENFKEIVKQHETDDKSIIDKKNELEFLLAVNRIPFNRDMERKDEAMGRKMLARFLYASMKSILFNMRHALSFASDHIAYALGLFTNDYNEAEEGSVQWISKTVEKIIDHSSVDVGFGEYFVGFFRNLKDTIEFLANDVLWHEGNPYLDIGINQDNHYASHFPTLQTSIKLITLMKSTSFLVERYFDMRYSHHLGNYSALSAGEIAMLNLYSRLKYAFDNPLNGDRSSLPRLILLDEAENTFHPEWQRLFIKRLTDFLNLAVPSDVKVQVIYTTHSPITLSDMPKGCTVFLKREGQRATNLAAKDMPATFGANVFDLYADSFFMNNGLIGEFASQKIKELAEEIERGDWCTNRARSEQLKIKIEEVADERIRSYLYSRVYHANPREEIRTLEDRIRKLRKRYEQ